MRRTHHRPAHSPDDRGRPQHRASASARRERRPRLYDGEWNDDFHHAAHVVATGESEGYYADYSDDAADLARSLAEGYVYQGAAVGLSRRRPAGRAVRVLPPTAFVNFLQNHDQIGNRAFGERLTTLTDAATVELLTAVLLLAPHTPLMFMGEEWGERRPFCYFTDFTGELATAVREGRRAEFKKWPQFADPANRERIPDPNAPETAAASRHRLEYAATPEGRGAPGAGSQAARYSRAGDRCRASPAPRAERRATRCSGRARSPSTWRLGFRRDPAADGELRPERARSPARDWGELRPIYEFARRPCGRDRRRPPAGVFRARSRCGSRPR